MLIYQTENGVTSVDVTFEEDTVRLTQEQMVDFFQKVKSTINEHIENVFEEVKPERQCAIIAHCKSLGEG